MSNLLSTWDLQQLRQTQESHLPDRVTILRRVLSDDGFGGVTHDSEQVIATNVPARITEAQMQDLGGQAARDLEIEKWTIRVPVGTDVQDEDFLLWTSVFPEVRFQVEDDKGRSNQSILTLKAEVVS